MENVVDVNGDLIGYLDDGFIRAKDDVEFITISGQDSNDIVIVIM